MLAPFKLICLEHNTMLNTAKKLLFLVTFACALSYSASAEDVTIDANAPHHPLPHFWEQMFGSGRAILSLRDSYRQDLIATKAITDFKYVRFHAIFHDEVGLYDEDAHGKAVYNYSYVDQIYDGLLENGVRPFVELSFMPRKLASRAAVHVFKYHPIVAPPKDYARWDAMIEALARHLIDRYGIDEVGQWYFEVWNEPNLDFWAGSPRQASYFTLYDHTARALKKVSPRLRVGGPATAQAAWMSVFIKHATEGKVPLDFVSTHVYGNDTADNVFGTHEKIARADMVCRAAQKVHDEVQASARPDLPIIWSEYNASYMNETNVTDSVFMGPWLAHTISRCDGLTAMMSYWTFSDVFEEQGVVKKPLYGGYGLIAAGGIPKPAFNAFKMLHALGDERIEVDSDHVLATRRADGTLVIAAWNYVAPGTTGTAMSVTLHLPTGARSARVSQLDHEHGDVNPAFVRFGSPDSPTRAQLAVLKRAAELPAAHEVPVAGDQVSVTLPPDGLATVEIGYGVAR
jgi:xylan 1,4-beta-xylosidase